MGLLHLLVAALAASVVSAADAPCACVDVNQKLNPIDRPMIFFQNPTKGGVLNGNVCSMNCTMVATAYDEENDGLSITLLSNDLKGAKITVSDGKRSFTLTKNSGQSDVKFNSSGPTFTVNFEESDGNDGVFMLVVQRATREDVPDEVITTLPPPTAPYDKKYLGNPLLVAQDIMIGIDLSSKEIENLKSFAIELIEALTITNATDCGAGTRLALHGLTNFDGFSPTYFPDWQYTATNAIGNINAMAQIGNGPFRIKPLDGDDGYVAKGFLNKKAEDTDPDNCPNRGRMYILLTSSQPLEYEVGEPKTAANGPIIKFLDKGVHPILVTSLQKTDKKNDREYYDQYETDVGGNDPLNKWATFDIGKGVTEFINNYLVFVNDELTCQPAKKDIVLKKIHEDDPNKAVVKIPDYYNAKSSAQDNEDRWDTAKHYCNFQTTTINITVDSTSADKTAKTDVCLTVYYDLDTGKDFVSIRRGDPVIPSKQKEVVRLTGRDVSGTTFHLGGTQGSIVFTSNEKDVYDGFYAKIWPCSI